MTCLFRKSLKKSHAIRLYQATQIPFMISTSKISVSLVIGIFLISGIAATTPPDEQHKWKNLKVLPKNTDEDQMERIMYTYTKFLGVTCSYCHPDTKPDVFPRRVDFATDELPEKIISRKMMRMTDKINQKYFNYKNKYDFASITANVFTCNTCHRGLKKPNNISLYIP
jgi:Photosynthetic reaction centre cytochrome C subunit